MRRTPRTVWPWSDVDGRIDRAENEGTEELDALEAPADDLAGQRLEVDDDVGKFRQSLAQPFDDLLARPMMIVVQVQDDRVERQTLVAADRASAPHVLEAVEQAIEPRPDRARRPAAAHRRLRRRRRARTIRRCSRSTRRRPARDDASRPRQSRRQARSDPRAGLDASSSPLPAAFYAPAARGAPVRKRTQANGARRAAAILLMAERPRPEARRPTSYAPDCSAVYGDLDRQRRPWRSRHRPVRVPCAGASVRHAGHAEEGHEKRRRRDRRRAEPAGVARQDPRSACSSRRRCRCGRSTSGRPSACRSSSGRRSRNCSRR